MKGYSREFCPVPEEQQPINEYEQLKESWIFSWVTLKPSVYLNKLTWVWFWGWFVAGPIAAASFHPQKYPIQFALAGSAGAGLFVTFVLVRIYLGWSYVCDRLSQETIFYEESGWYDGQTWSKPTTMLNRDRLIVSYQVKPIVARLHKTALIIAILAALGGLVWLTFD
ncbi:MAG: CGLD27 family protein [Xenococcaceae cyanobacterium]